MMTSAATDRWGQATNDDNDDEPELLGGDKITNDGDNNDDVFSGDNDDDDDDSNDDDMLINNNPNSNNNKGKTPSGDDNGGDLTDQQKLQLAERANEIYRQQLKYMQDHLASLRALIQDKENIIENLMLRYDLGIINQDQNKNGSVNSDDIDHGELRRKAEALAQRTILENFELREMVNELRDENFHLRNEIYELQDKINRQVLQINKLEKQVEQQAKIIEENENERMALEEANNNNNNTNNDDNNNNNSVTDDGGMREPDHDVENQMGRRKSKQWDHPANAPDARQKRLEREEKRHKKQDSLYAPHSMFPTNDSDNDDNDDDDDDDDDDNNPYKNTDEAKKKRAERQGKQRRESVKTPNLFGSTGLEVDLDDPEIKRKQEERAQKGRRESIATPNVFGDNDDDDDDDDLNGTGARLSNDENEEPNDQIAIEEQKNSDEAKTKRAQRKKNKHKKSESIVYQELFLNKDEREDFMDDSKEALQRRKEQRRKSKQMLAKHVGDKGHLSDEDVNNPRIAKQDKPRRYEYDLKKGQRKAARSEAGDIPISSSDRKRASLSGAAAMMSADNAQSSHHRRDSSAPVVNMGFEDPDVLLHFEQLKVKDLELELAKRNDAYDIQTAQMNELRERIKSLETDIQSNTSMRADTTAVKNSENDKIISQLRETQEQLRKNNEENELQLRQEQSKCQEIYQKLKESKDALNEAISTKASLASRCSSEIMRLSAIINQLLEIPNINDSVQLLINESFKSKTYQMSQQDY